MMTDEHSKRLAWAMRRFPLFLLLVIPATIVSVWYGIYRPHLTPDVVPLAYQWIHGFCWGHDWKPYKPQWPELDHCWMCQGVRKGKRSL